MEKIIFLSAGSYVDPQFDGAYDKKELENRGIKVNKPAIQSCHGCPDIMDKYSQQMQDIVDKGNRVVGLMEGGLYLAAPSIQATQVTYPIISCPLDLVAYQGMMVPSGHAVIAGVGVDKTIINECIIDTTQREKAFTVAENILNMEKDTVTLGGDGNLGKLENYLEQLGIAVRSDSNLKLTYGSRPGLGVQGDSVQVWADTQTNLNSGAYFEETEDFLSRTSNTVQVRGDKNLAIFAAKIISLQRPDVKENVTQIGKKKRSSYVERNLVKELGL